MMDTSLFIVGQLEVIMINVPSKLAPNMTLERPVCHRDVVFVIWVTLQDVTQHTHTVTDIIQPVLNWGRGTGRHVMKCGTLDIWY